MNRTIVALLVLSGSAAVGCGGGDPEPYTLTLNSVDVIQRAVDKVTIVFEPEGLDQDFAMTQSMAFDDANVLAETVITPGGRRGYRVTLQKPYVEANFLEEGSAFKLPVFLTTTDHDDPVIANPRVLVTFLRRDVEIAVGERQITWPLEPGLDEEVRISCLATTRLQCTNNDP